MKTPPEFARALGELLREEGFKRSGRRPLWIREGTIHSAISVTAVDASEDGRAVWLELAAHAVSDEVLRADGVGVSDGFIGNYISWTVDQADFGGPTLFEYRTDNPGPCITLARELLGVHLLPACIAITEDDLLFRHLNNRVTESPQFFLQFIVWAARSGRVEDAERAAARASAAARREGQPLPSEAVARMRALGLPEMPG